MRGITHVPDTETTGGAMTRSEHYEQAGTYVREAYSRLNGGDEKGALALATIAQVHATLATITPVHATLADSQRGSWQTTQQTAGNDQGIEDFSTEQDQAQTGLVRKDRRPK